MKHCAPNHILVHKDDFTKSEATNCNGFWDLSLLHVKMQRAITQKNKITFFLNFHQVIYSLSSISCPSLKPLAVIFLRYQAFYVQIVKGQSYKLRKNKRTFFKFSPVHQLIILYLLTKFEAPSCYNFQDILITKFHFDPLKGRNSTMGDNLDLKQYVSTIYDDKSIHEISKL